MFKVLWLKKAQVRDLYDQALTQVETKALVAYINSVIAPTPETIQQSSEYDGLVSRLHEDYRLTMESMSDDASVDPAEVSANASG